MRLTKVFRWMLALAAVLWQGISQSTKVSKPLKSNKPAAGVVLANSRKHCARPSSTPSSSRKESARITQMVMADLDQNLEDLPLPLLSIVVSIKGEFILGQEAVTRRLRHL